MYDRVLDLLVFLAAISWSHGPDLAPVHTSSLLPLLCLIPSLVTSAFFLVLENPLPAYTTREFLSIDVHTPSRPILGCGLTNSASIHKPSHMRIFWFMSNSLDQDHCYWGATILTSRHTTFSRTIFLCCTVFAWDRGVASVRSAPCRTYGVGVVSEAVSLVSPLVLSVTGAAWNLRN